MLAGDSPAGATSLFAGLDTTLSQHARAAGVNADIVRSLDMVWEPLDALDPLAKQALVEGLVGDDGQVARLDPGPEGCCVTIACKNNDD